MTFEAIDGLTDRQIDAIDSVLNSHCENTAIVVAGTRKDVARFSEIERRQRVPEYYAIKELHAAFFLSPLNAAYINTITVVKSRFLNVNPVQTSLF